MKNCYIISGDFVSTGYKFLPTIYFELKEYYKANGKHYDKYNFMPPIFMYPTTAEIKEIMDRDKPDIVGLSIYMWNNEYMYEIAEFIKATYPDVLLIAGGPHLEAMFADEFYEDHSFFDIFVTDTGPETFNEILDLFIDQDHLINRDVYNANGIIHRKNGIQEENPIVPIKADMKWKSNWVQEFAEEITEMVTDLIASGERVQSFYEASKRCPYQCSFCELGIKNLGKVQRKPIDTILADIEVLTKAKVDRLHFGEKNFGIFKDDYVIAEKIVECKKKYGYPTSIELALAKNNLAAVERILDILIEGEVIQTGILAIQDTNQEVLNINGRIDDEIEDKIDMSERLTAKYGIGWTTDLIIAMPGQTVETQIDTHAYLLSRNPYLISKISSFYSVTPGAPLIRDGYDKKYDVKFSNYKVLPGGVPGKAKTQEAYDHLTQHGVNVIPVDYDTEFCYITSTFSFTTAELADMLYIDYLFNGLSSAKGFSIVAHTQLKEHFKLDMYRFYTDIADIAMNDGSSLLYEVREQVTTILYDWLMYKRDYNDIDVDPSVTFTLAPHHGTHYLLLEQIDRLFDNLLTAAKRQSSDPLLDDLFYWCRQSFLDMSYNPDNGRSFVSRNWATDPSQTVKIDLHDQHTYYGKNQVKIAWYIDGKVDKQSYVFQTCMGATIATSREQTITVIETK